MQFTSKTTVGKQVLQMRHQLQPEAAKTMAKTTADALRLNLKESGVKATVSVKYRKTSFDLIIKFASADEQKKLEDLDKTAQTDESGE